MEVEVCLYDIPLRQDEYANHRAHRVSCRQAHVCLLSQDLFNKGRNELRNDQLRMLLYDQSPLTASAGPWKGRSGVTNVVRRVAEQRASTPILSFFSYSWSL